MDDYEILNENLEKVRKKIEKFEETGDTGELDEWKKILNQLNDIKKRVYNKAIFSENEEFKDIKTEDLKFLLVAYYQAETIQKFMDNRESILTFALQFYDEFFKLLEKYDYLPKEKKEQYKKLKNAEEEEENKGKPSMEQMTKDREEKIQAFKYKKTISEKLKVNICIKLF